MARKLKDKVKDKFRKEQTKYSSEVDASKDIEKLKCDFVVEGQTEEYYLKSLRDNPLFLYVIAKIYNLKGCEGGGIFETYNQTIKKLFKNPRPRVVVCVFDVDVCYANQTNYNKYKSLLSYFKYEIEKKDIVICESMPSIEFWFLAHYVNTSRFMTADNVITALRKYIPTYGKADKNLSSLN